MTINTLRIEQRQHHTLTPRLQQAVRLLQLSSLDFAQELQHALDSNPFLEAEDDESAAPVVAASDATGWDDDAAAAAMPEQGIEFPTARSGSSSHSSGDGDLSLVELMAARVSLREHLHAQINVMTLPERDHALAALVVESIDDDGYMRLTFDELSSLAASALKGPNAQDDELKIALRLVQSLDPAGVGARDLRECLQLQAAQIEDAAERSMVERILAEPLERLAARDVMKLARTLDADPVDVEAACERIRRFDPRPGWRFDSSRIEYVTPDVIVRRSGSRWVAMLNPDVVPKVRLNRVYAELFQQHRSSGHGELAAHLREARWTLRNVEQRFSTILDVAEAIVRRQHHFFEFGPLAMKPMCLREIAEEVGLHESTVCRVTNNKYMATPSGVFELKYFFSRALPTTGGGAASATAIRGLIRELIEAESPADPLSDVQIARQLARQGINVARRTVTKYRQMMRLPAVERRRRFVHEPATA